MFSVERKHSLKILIVIINFLHAINAKIVEYKFNNLSFEVCKNSWSQEDSDQQVQSFLKLEKVQAAKICTWILESDFSLYELL